MMRPLFLSAFAVFAFFVGAAHAADLPGLRLLQSAIGLGAAPDGSPVEVRTFYQNEKIRFYVKVSVDSTPGAAGDHRLVYKWYTADAVANAFDAHKKLDVGQTDWWAYISVSHLAPGPHRAELYIDDQLFASGEFEISAATRPYEPEEDTAIKTASLALLLAGDTHRFDELAAHYRASQERTSSGTWKLSLLYNSVDESSFAPADSRWQQLEALSETWLAKQPESATAVAMSARILFAHAWAWRIAVNADDMPPEHRQRYEQLIERARNVLDRHAGVAQQDPEWDTLRISIARQQGANTDAVLAMAERALQRWPYFYPIHNAAVNALLPRWGGSRRAIQTYTKLALQYSRPLEGTEAYARIYYYIARTAGDALDELNRMDGDFSTFQRSMGEILKKYPSAFNRDIARGMTYLAGDAAAYRSYGRASTGGVIPIARWDTAEQRDWANQWAFEGKHATHVSPLRRIRAYLSLFRQGPEFWEPLRWGALAAVLLIEVGFRLLAWRARRSLASSLTAQFAIAEFNPLEYPRTYHVMPLGRMSTRIGIWLLVFCGAAAYILTTVAWPDPQETRIVMGGLIAVAAGGALIVANVITSRVILRADGLELRRLVGGRSIRRSDILGIRAHATPTPALEVVLHTNADRPLWVMPVLGEDQRFRSWFESLPALDPVADDDEAEDGEGAPAD